MSGIGYDEGLSGLSTYMHQVLNILNKSYNVTIVLLEKDYIKFPKDKIYYILFWTR